jgi:hypothetical protein
VCARRRHGTVVHEMHDVADRQRFGPMRDQQYDPVAGDFPERQHQTAFRAGVERRGRFVEDQHVGLAQQSARDRDPLLLAD